MAELILKTNRLVKRYDSLEILRGIDFELREKEIVSIVGPSGAGKSTFLHLVGLMEHPTGGDIQLSGRFLSGLSDKERARIRLEDVGFLFQFHYLLPDFNLLENVLIPCRLAGDDLRSARTEARQLLDRLGLSERLDHRPSELSGGEQQRAALARAMIRRPKLLLCDEPTGNLDEQTAEDVAGLMWEEMRRQNLSGIIVTHNEKLAQRADKELRLEHGNFHR